MSQRERRALGPIGFGLALALPVVLAGLFLVWTRVTTFQLGYRLDRAQRSHDTLMREQARLRFEVEVKSAPQRLVPQCGGQRGLRLPTAEQVIDLRRR